MIVIVTVIGTVKVRVKVNFIIMAVFTKDPFEVIYPMTSIGRVCLKYA